LSIIYLSNFDIDLVLYGMSFGTIFGPNYDLDAKEVQIRGKIGQLHLKN
jgi:hypothetical protein